MIGLILVSLLISGSGTDMSVQSDSMPITSTPIGDHGLISWNGYPIDGEISPGLWVKTDPLPGESYSIRGGRMDAYILGGSRWYTNKVNFTATDQLTYDATIYGMNMWGSTRAPIGDVLLDPSASKDVYDKKSTVGLLNLQSGALGWTRTYYAYNNGVYINVESDISLNSQYLDNIMDVHWGTVTGHELGHSWGLGDIYGVAQFKDDTDQLMHYYIGPKTSIHNGDRVGVNLLYGGS